MGSPSEALERHLDLSTADLEAVIRVAANIQLTDLHLRYVNSFLGPLFPDEIERGWQEHALLTYDAHLLSNRELDWDQALPEDQTGFLVRTVFRAEYDETWVNEGEASPDKEGGQGISESRDELDFSLMAVFDLNYELRNAESLTRRDLEHFAAVNSVFNAWPYWRELAQSTTQRMGIDPPLIVPVFTVSPLQTES